MVSIIGQNQATSAGVYARSVADAAALPIDFMKVHAGRVDRAYAAGEPVWMIVAELQMVHATRPLHKPTKTPRALAQRVEIVK